MATNNQEIVALLCQSYSMELETVCNYLSNSINPDGVRAEEIKKSLGADIASELLHATQLGQRIKQLGGTVPGSLALKFDQKSLQPGGDSTEIVAVIRAVIEAEEAAVAQYKRIIKATEGEDYVTQDLAIRLLADEEEHLVQFKGFLKEYQR